MTLPIPLDLDHMVDVGTLSEKARQAAFIRAMDTLELQGMVTSLEIEGAIRYRLTEKGKEYLV